MDRMMEDRLTAFLDSKRHSFEAAPGFEDRVMAALRNAETPALRSVRGADRGAGWTGWAARREAWRRRLRGLLATPLWRASLAPACLALALGIGLYLGPMAHPGGESEADTGGTRIKGRAFAFAMLVQEGDTGYRQVEGEEARLRAGDRIQALYWLAETAYVELLSLDARGKAECYSCGKPAGPFGPAAGQPLPFGLELDPTPGPELFVLAASQGRKSPDQLGSRLERAWREAGMDLEKAAARLRRDEGETRYRTLLVRKGARP